MVNTLNYFVLYRSNLISTVTARSFTATILRKKREIASGRLQKALKRKVIRKRLTRIGLVTANLIVLVGVIWFVVAEAPSDTAPVHASQIQAPAVEVALSPVDKFTTSDVAVSVAQATKLEESTAVLNQAQSAKVAVLMSASDTNIAAKPQIVDTSLKSWRDIREYKVVAGDTVSSVAQKFSISSDAIRWSNGITGDALTVGASIFLPPSEGIAHLVVAGDTPASLATKYHVNADQISADNDAEQSALVVGRRVFIANGQIIAAPARAVSATTYAASSSFSPRYGSNGYDWGWCTYYAAGRAGAPANWGNANTWAYFARLSGWVVSSSPTAGAIFQTSSGWAGHVGIVEEVSPDGLQMKISDMNGIAGFGRVGYSGWISSSTYPNYISRS